MTFEQIIKIAFMMAVLCYIAELIFVVKKNIHTSKRLEVAEKRNWIVKAKKIKSIRKDTTKKRDYQSNITHMAYIVHYEYELDGVKKKLKIYSDRDLPYERTVYYDAENNNKVLNEQNDTNIRFLVLLPISIFVAIILLLKNIFHV